MPCYAWWMLSKPALDRLTDQALLDQFGDLVRQDRQHTASLLKHIDEIDRRKLWAKYGHSCLFDFCVARYHMSESTAGKRIGAARTARRFPILFEMVARGEIHLSGIHRIKAHLTPENHVDVLARAKHKTIRQLEELVAHLAPRRDAPSTLRALPERHEVAGPPRRAPDPEPLAPGRYRLQVTLDESAHQKLRQLQDLLSHQIPNGDPAAVVARALDALLTQVQKEKIGITDKPRATQPIANPPAHVRTAPRALRREVWTRDEGRCSFVGVDGHRCNETRGLEFAHLRPWAKGGEHSAENLALRCRSHNAFEADRDYGASFMASKRTRPLKVREPQSQYVTRARLRTLAVRGTVAEHEQLKAIERRKPGEKLAPAQQS